LFHFPGARELRGGIATLFDRPTLLCWILLEEVVAAAIFSRGVQEERKLPLTMEVCRPKVLFPLFVGVAVSVDGWFRQLFLAVAAVSVDSCRHLLFVAAVSSVECVHVGAIVVPREQHAHQLLGAAFFVSSFLAWKKKRKKSTKAKGLQQPCRKKTF